MRFHGNDHIWLQHSLDVLAQFQASLATIVMAEHSKRVAISENTIFEKIVFTIDIVQFVRDVATSRTGLNQFQSSAVDFAVDFPQFHVAIARHVIQK
jgi:hypothetical protein